MRLPKLLLLIALGATGLAAGMSPARADICSDLWYERNSIYHDYGYCFKTQKAISVFGNAGCMYNNEGAIPMSYADKSRVLAIKKREKRLGCL